MQENYLALEGAIGAEFQQSLSPENAVELLKAGVKRSMSNQTNGRNRAQLLQDAAGGQYPYAAVLSCIDSRAPVEQIFDAASGDDIVRVGSGDDSGFLGLGDDIVYLTIDQLQGTSVNTL